jgi:hypothetical protein
VTASQRPTAFLTGTLVDPAGKPVMNAESAAFSPSYTEQSPLTDATGRFRIGPLLTGRYTLWFRAAGFPDHEVACDHELVANETFEVGEVRLVIGGTIAARVRGEASDGLELEVSTFDPALEQTGDYELVRVVDGSARTRPLAAGRYLLQVGSERIAHAAYRVEVSAGHETEVGVALVRGIPTTLRLPYAKRAKVTISDVGGNPVLVQSIFYPKHFIGPDLLQITPALLPGPYHIVVTSDAGTAEGDITVGAKGDQVFAIEAPANGR